MIVLSEIEDGLGFGEGKNGSIGIPATPDSVTEEGLSDDQLNLRYSDMSTILEIEAELFLL